MLFDRLCGIAERQIHSYIPLLKKAAYFNFPYHAHNVLPKNDEITQEDRDDAVNFFVLPFDIVAIEDTASCVLLKPVKPGITGIMQSWYWIEVLNLKVKNDKAFYDPKPDPETEYLASLFPEDAYSICDGTITPLTFTAQGYTLESIVGNIRIGNKDGVTDGKTFANKYGVDLPMEGISKKFGKNAMTALEELMLLNSKERFILEKRPLKPKVGGKQIPRAHQRPAYTLLTIKEIHETLDRDPVVQRERAGLTEPHYRRRHWRSLRHEKYKRDDEGKVKRILIDPIWVGSRVATVGHNRYEVRIDL